MLSYVFRMFNRGAYENKLNSTDLQMFTSHLALLLSCGFPLVKILETLGAGEPPQSEVCAKLGQDIFQGASLSKAMSHQPESFPANYIHVVRVGETTGRLTDCLDRLAVTLEQKNRLGQLLFQILIYPAVLLVVCILLMGFAVYGIFPMIIKVTSESKVELPAITKALVYISSAQFLATVTIALMLMAALVAAVLRNPARARRVRLFWETSTPIGHFQVESCMVTCLRQLALMLECGIDLMRALALLKDVATDSLLLEKAFVAMQFNISQGYLLGHCFADNPVFPGFVTLMVSAGEESASTHLMMNRAADIMEDDLYRQARTLATLAEPVMLGFLGISVGTIMLATLLPIYKMVNF